MRPSRKVLASLGHLNCQNNKNLFVNNIILLNSIAHFSIYGPGSSVGIATDYGIDGPESNPGGDEIFRSSRPVL